MNIQYQRINLRSIEVEDLEFLRKMINDPKIEELIIGWSFPVSRVDQEIWLKNSRNNSNTQRWIIENEKNEVIGLSILRNIDWKNRSAIHGIKIYQPNQRNKGYGSEVLQAIQNYCFYELNFNRLSTSILETNTRSLHLYEKCGWKNEGRERKAIYKSGKFIDKINLGILREDYKKSHEVE